ncbi:MAG TPA: glycosyltransferase [Chitinophagales bacterium]|nr:glycosyltransferase [Chitinophagales bacterium]
MTDPFLIAAIAFASLYFIMVMYFFIGWVRLKRYDVKTAPAGTQPFVSVVIPTRNESKYIKACLEAIFAQNYPADKFEVIVVDDYSTDPTIRFAREINKPNLLVLDLQQYLGNPGEYVPNKKKAIALGVKNAKGELIITTDGDCNIGPGWLATMAGYYSSHPYKLVTGPVMVKPAYSPLAWFQQLDVLTMLGITGATIRNNFPTMCNGANLMYAKQVFLDVEGFKGNNDIPTGDDIFLMHKVNQRYPGAIGFVKSFDACVFTKPESGLGGFLSQRTRWVSKSRNIGNWQVTLVLVFAYFFNLFVIGAGIYYALQPVGMNWLPLAVAGSTKLAVDFLFAIPVSWFYRKIILLLLLPFVEIFHILYVVIIGVVSQFGRYRWKDRLVR